VLSFKAALHGFLFLRDMGVLGIFRNAAVAVQTFAGSFAFLRLLVSLTIRGWEEVCTIFLLYFFPLSAPARVLDDPRVGGVLAEVLKSPMCGDLLL
jgi:hypothetical protein